jgi:hypothetical protein
MLSSNLGFDFGIETDERDLQELRPITVRSNRRNDDSIDLELVRARKNALNSLTKKSKESTVIARILSLIVCFLIKIGNDCLFQLLLNHFFVPYF